MAIDVVASCWRSTDKIGTRFNRWIDDDTFDNQALIKDEQGRVLLDTTIVFLRVGVES